MFQKFDTSSTPDLGPPRLTRLRAELRSEGLDGFLIPKADAHQGEYVAPRDERLAWLTGFTGSAGICVALQDTAAVFADGRYRIQARTQTDPDTFQVVPWPDTRPGDWIKTQISAGVIGFDPWLHTAAEVDALRKSLAPIELQAVDNLIDRIWDDQPAAPTGAAMVYPAHLAGAEHLDKRARIASDLRDAGEKAAVITLPDSIAWLLNIRGSDLPRVPVAQGFAVLHDNGRVDLFMDPAKLTDVVEHLGNQVTCHKVEDFLPALRTLTGPVRVDRDSAPLCVGDALPKDALTHGRDPVVLAKACKSDVEIAGTRQAHLRDGQAMVRFLHWLDTALASGETLTEIDVVKRLEQIRAEPGDLRDISFDTICGAGPNGAIVHYRVTEDTNRTITRGDVLLVDSGGQYLDGTTDITRTMATGPVPAEVRRAYTRVLQGLIAISRTRFPKGLAGRDLDALARAGLWREGWDYDHGTGHGVGVFLSVHEGPQRLSRQSTEPLKPGMILSNEPGYYRADHFGIRLENLIVTVEAAPLPGGDARDMLCFDTLTWCPFDRRMISAELLSADERDWLNAYHDSCRKLLSRGLDVSTQEWLIQATAPV